MPCRTVDYLKDSWKVATTFMGTVVGAGFASGQEILTFFSHFGSGGIMGIFVSTLLFAVAGTAVMLLGRRLSAVSFGNVVRYVCGKKLGPVMDLLLGLFLFGTLSVMLAGSGAIFFQQWGLPFWAGTLTTAAISIITVLFKMKGIIKANCFIVPLMVFICITVTLPAVSPDLIKSNLKSFVPADIGAAPHWLLSALLYVSYNVALSVSVLAPLGRVIGRREALITGGILGALGLGVLAAFINFAILSHYPQSAQYEVPSLFVAGRLAMLFQLVFSFVLWAEIFTTIIGTIYGIAARASEYFGLNYNGVTVGMMLLALALSGLGFSGLVGTLYPLFGYFSMIFLGCLLAHPLLNRKQSP